MTPEHKDELQKIIDKLSRHNVHVRFDLAGEIELFGDTEQVNRFMPQLEGQPELMKDLKEYLETGSEQEASGVLQADKERQDEKDSELTAGDVLKVLSWFRNEREEAGGVCNPYQYYFPENLALRMQKGRKAGEPKSEGSPAVWKTGQPPIDISEAKIKACLSMLVSYGFLWTGELHEAGGGKTDRIYWLN